MPDLEDGESIEVQGSGSNKYTIKNFGEVYSCTCPAWRNQSLALDRRTCKHIKNLRGEAAELARIGGAGAPSSGAASATAKASAPAKASPASAGGQDGPPILLANSWDNAQDLSGWWMSEKLDGVRAYWDGQAFLSRLGNKYHAPDWFTAGLPSFPLDGELWGGRKRFQRTISVVRRQDKSNDWKQISFVVFDAPAMDAPFEERLDAARKAIDASQSAYARLLEQERCKDLAHLRAELARVESLGGEGLMMRQPTSRYEVGRSSSLLKVKSFFDAEALVKEHVAGAGKHQGRLGALVVELADGTRFSVGTGFSDKERASPPPVGSVVTFRYQELTEAGVPRFPSYVGVRDDIQWPPDNALVKKAAASPSSPLPLPPLPEGRGGVASASASASAPVSMVTPVSVAVPSLIPATEAAPVPMGVFQEGAPRRFERWDGSIRAVWEITLRGRALTVRTGGSWASGGSSTRDFESGEAALREAEALVREKVRGGYQEARG